MKYPAAFLLLLGNSMAELNGTCWDTTVIHSVADGWNDGCLGLDKKPNVTSEADCKAQCVGDIGCSVWQWVSAEGASEELQCWSGNKVHGCSARDGQKAEFKDNLLAGERLQHGRVKVVAIDNNTEFIGLKRYPEDTGNQSEKIARCQLACFTDVTCTVWQFAGGNDGDNGCWRETGPGNLKKGNRTGSDFAKAMIIGETIEHYCPPVPVKEEDAFPWPWVIAGIILGLLALAAILYYMLKKTPKVKKTRAIKVKEPEPEEPKPVITTYFIPQPTVLVPQPQQTVIVPQQSYVVPQYSTPTITTAQYQPLLTGGSIIR